MKWFEFLTITKDLPVIDAEVILTNNVDAASTRVQLSRWVKSGNLIQLRRGIYVLGDTYRKKDINEYHIASILVKPSYISFEKALEYHGLIPEAVYVYTSATAKRPQIITTPIGSFNYRHIKSSLFWGYDSVVMSKQQVFVANPEKALLDFFYINHQKVTLEYLVELRLQHVHKIDIKRLFSYSNLFKKSNILHAAVTIKKYKQAYQKKEKNL